MADVYCDDGGSATSPYETWAKAINDLDAAFDYASAGDTIYIGHNHSKIYSANITYSSAGTISNPVKVISATQGSTPPTLASGAYEESGAGYDINFSGHTYIYGVSFKCGDDFSLGTNSYTLFDTCTIILQGDYDLINTGIGGCGVFINSDFDFSAHNRMYFQLQYGGKIYWYGGTLTGNPDRLVKGGTSAGNFYARGVDLSSITGAGKYLTACHTTSGSELCHITFDGCKLAASNPPVVQEGTIAVKGFVVRMISCYSSGVPYIHENPAEGDIYLDTAEYLDATYDGTNGYSIKLVTSANANYYMPLRWKLADIWCDANPTLTVHFTHDINGDNSDAQDDELWIEIEYPDSTVPAYRKWDRTSRMTLLGTAADLTTEADPGWNVGQGAYNSIAETISGGAAGIHTVWVCLARASETVYVDPKVDVT